MDPEGSSWLVGPSNHQSEARSKDFLSKLNEWILGKTKMFISTSKVISLMMYRSTHYKKRILNFQIQILFRILEWNPSLISEFLFESCQNPGVSSAMGESYVKVASIWKLLEIPFLTPNPILTSLLFLCISYEGYTRKAHQGPKADLFSVDSGPYLSQYLAYL